MQEEQGNSEPEAFGVLPENWNAVQVFFSLTTQWRVDRGGVLAGLRYGALEIVMAHQDAEPHDTFARVQIMERAAVDQSRRMAPKP